MNTKLKQDFIKLCNDGWLQGWHERNGGNLSCRLTEAEVEEARAYFNENAEWREIGAEVPGLANEYFMVRAAAATCAMSF